MRRFSVLVLGLSSWCACVVARADTLAIYPTADNTIYTDLAAWDEDAGTESLLHVSRSAGDPPYNTFNEDRALIEFSLRNLSINTVIQSATLSFQTASVSGSAAVEVHGYAGTGAPTRTYSSIASNPISAMTPIASPAVTTITLDTAYVQSLVATHATLGASLKHQPVFGGITLYSNEGAIAQSKARPTLSLQYQVVTPTPPTLPPPTNQPPHLFMTNGVSGISEYTLAGASVGAVTAPYPITPRPTAESGFGGVAVDQYRRIHTLNGSTHTYLTTFDPATSKWRNQLLDDYDVKGRVSLTAWNDCLFTVPNDGSGNNRKGIVRINTIDGTVDRAGNNLQGPSLDGVAMGRDGVLYGFDNTHVYGYNPQTMVKTLDRILTLPVNGFNDLAVDADGNIFGLSYNTYESAYGIYKFLSGQTSAIETLFFPTTIFDIDMAADGTIVANGSGGTYLTDRSLTGYTSVPLSGGASGGWVTFGGAALPEPSSLAAIAAGAALVLRRRPVRR